MHGCGSGSALLVNAEVDSMGGVVDGGVGIGIKTSPRRAAIEKAQAELRQEYDVREERRRELEFLEKGGNPLDFKFGNGASVSVQSTSLTDHHTEHFVTSEAKGSFALTASPHGDSVESSGRPGVPTICEPNSADNFHGENELLEGERKVKHPARRNKIVPSEQSSEMDGAQNPKESEDSAIFHSYARRNRSRPNRDAARSSSTDVVQSSVGHGSSLPVRGGSRDVKGSVSETKSQKEHTTPSASILKSTSNGDVLPQIECSTTRSNMDLDGLEAPETKENLPKDRLEGVTQGNNLMDNHSDQPVEGDSKKICVDIGSEVCDRAAGKEQVISADPEAAPKSDTKEFENKTSSVQLNGFGNSKGDEIEGQNGIATTRTKVLDPEFSYSQNSLRAVANNDSELCVTQINEASDVILTEQTPECEERNVMVCSEKEHQKDEIMGSESCTAISDDCNLVDQNPSSNGSVLKTDEVKCPLNIEEIEQNNDVVHGVDKKLGNSIDGNSGLNRENIFPGGPQASGEKSIQEVPASSLLEKNSAPSDPQLCPGSPLKFVDKAREDSILEEARIIEAKRKRIAELSVGTIQQESRRKTHWDFVLEEMAWLANDFAQERLWKMTAAAQICHRVALTNRLRVEGQNQVRKLKRVAYTLAKAVMQFWNSAEILLNNEDQSSCMKNCNNESRRLDCGEFSKDKFGEQDKETCNKLESQNPGKSFGHALHGYAVRFLRSNSSPVPSVQAEAPATPDRITDLGIMDASWDDNLTEESLFYAVPSGAMETYRASIESHVAQCEKTGSSMQEEVDTSMYDAAAEIGYHENIYDEEEGETSTYYLPGVYEGNKSMKHDQKKRKVFMKSYSGRSYEADLPYGHPAVVSQQHALMGKRSGNNLQVGSIPTKRMRTAAVVRQRVISPFGGAGTAVPLPAPAKTDASSGDTSSFQDDQSTLHGGFQIQKSMEVESVADFERQLPYDCAETSTKPKKKKKAKHLGSSYDPVWQLDSIVNNEQRDNSRKRVEGHHFDSNGTSGSYVQHAAKKPKIGKQSLDNSFDNMSGSIPSPAASQMSNMSNTNRFMKIINGQKGRKNKSSKVPAVQPGSGSPWSLFEDQALVVLVHDMGPNWELVSDAINSTLQFKCIFRKPQECKERHKGLMDKGAGDGADSADDSGSSQSYPSTLPGIPKGSARQLFQRLQGPMLEETLKSHFEKIIMIGKKQLYRRNQNDNQDAKQLAAVHNSHVIALSQVCPNNLNGGFLTPLDLCDASASSPDVLPLGYQGSHASGLPMPNQGAVAPMLSSTGANSLQGSSGVVLGNNSTSPSGPLTAPFRDGRYSIPRASLQVDEQQRIQHYNQMLSGRNMQQSNLSVSSALTGSDRRMLSGGSGMGMMPGVSRSMPLSRPAYQGMASSPMLNSGTKLSSNTVGMPSTANMHSGTGSAPGNSLMRPREALNMMRPGHNPEHQRQMVVPEIQMQVSQGNSPGIPSFNGLSSGFANQTTSPPVQGFPGHPQQHQMSAHQSHLLNNPHLQNPNQVTGPQQAYAMRLAKERQMQQRILQQQQLAASSALMPHVQPQPQLPTSSSVQNSSQVQSPSSQPSTMPPLTPSSPLTPISMQQQQKHNLPHHGLNRNPQAAAIGLSNQVAKQRQRQPQQQQQFQQSGRHHPQQRQHSQSPQQAKIMKGMGRGNMVMHQNLPMDPSHLNGLSVPSGNQSVEKGDQIMHLVQGQGLYPGASLSTMQPSKPLLPQSSNHSQQQPKVFSGSNPPSSKQLQQVPSHSDNGAQGQVHQVSSGHGLGATHQPISSSTMVSNHQHLQSQSHQKQVSQSQQSVQRIPQLNRPLSSDLPGKTQNDQGLTDQPPMNSVPQMASSTTAAMPQACSESANAVPVVSSAVTSQWKQSESLYDTGLSTPVLQVGSTGSSCLASSAGSESALSASKGLGPRQLSGGLSQHGHSTGSQWQQQPQQSKIPQASQQQFQPQEQQLQEQDLPRGLPVQQQSQQQAHLQKAQSSAYVRPTNSKLD